VKRACAGSPPRPFWRHSVLRGHRPAACKITFSHVPAITSASVSLKEAHRTRFFPPALGSVRERLVFFSQHQMRQAISRSLRSPSFCTLRAGTNFLLDSIVTLFCNAARSPATSSVLDPLKFGEFINRSLNDEYRRFQNSALNRSAPSRPLRISGELLPSPSPSAGPCSQPGDSTNSSAVGNNFFANVTASRDVEFARQARSPCRHRSIVKTGYFPRVLCRSVTR